MPSVTKQTTLCSKELSMWKWYDQMQEPWRVLVGLFLLSPWLASLNAGEDSVWWNAGIVYMVFLGWARILPSLYRG